MTTQIAYSRSTHQCLVSESTEVVKRNIIMMGGSVLAMFVIRGSTKIAVTDLAFSGGMI
jgi:hypothetical protein